jgi:hypothetical protein
MIAKDQSPGCGMVVHELSQDIVIRDGGIIDVISMQLIATQHNQI